MTTGTSTNEVGMMSEHEFSVEYGYPWLLLSDFQREQFLALDCVNRESNHQENREAAVRLAGAFCPIPVYEFILWLNSDNRKQHIYWGKQPFPADLSEVEAWIKDIFFNNRNVEGVRFAIDADDLMSAQKEAFDCGRVSGESEEDLADTKTANETVN